MKLKPIEIKEGIYITPQYCRIHWRYENFVGLHRLFLEIIQSAEQNVPKSKKNIL